MKTIKVSSWASRLLASVALHPETSRSLARHVGRSIRAMVLKFRDPACRVVPAGFAVPLLMPLSHEMPSYRAKFPRYDRLPPFIARLIRQRRGSLRMVDVGANIGDTIASTSPKAGDRYIALEPHPVFFQYLLENMAGVESVECIQLACSEEAELLGFDSQTKGTAAPSKDFATPLSVQALPLDVIWQEQWHRARVDFLKIDTDGFDASVIRSALELLATWRPWLYYECDVHLTKGGMAELLDVPCQLLRCGYKDALAFDNFGEFVDRLQLDDTLKWEKLMSCQSANGPVFYHDILIIPPKEDASVVFSEYLMRQSA